MQAAAAEARSRPRRGRQPANEWKEGIAPARIITEQREINGSEGTSTETEEADLKLEQL